MSEARSEPLYVRVRPAVRNAVERDARDKGQSLSVWVERACMAVLGLEQQEIPANED